LAIGPLFVNATVTPALGAVTVNVSWSLSVPPGRRLEDMAQDLFLLWPGGVERGSAPGRAGPGLAPHVAERGFDAVGDGRLAMRIGDRSMLGTAAPGQPLPITASYVSFVRRGAAPSQIGAGTYVRIPWTARMADPQSVFTLPITFSTLITPRPATWF